MSALNQTEDITNNRVSSETTNNKKPWLPRRYMVSLLAFFGFWNVYALRVNLSVAIVAMTNNYTIIAENGTEIITQDFDWDSTTKGIILSSFFWGYILTQVPGGWLSAKYGGAKLYGSGIAVTAFFTLLTPLAARSGITVLFAVRVLEGFFEGVTYPCIHAVWSRWAPPLERSRLATIAFSGSYVGTVVALPVSGYIAKTLGWPWVFYVFGVIGLIWYVVWLIMVKESPAKDPYISKEELAYIQESLGRVSKKKPNPPWKKIFTSLPVLAIVAAHFSENWGFYTLLTQLPSFMKDTLEFDLKNAGIMSALPYLAMAILLQISGQIADFLLTRKIFSVTTVRKTFTFFGFISQTIFMMLAAYLMAPIPAVACLTVAVGLGGFAWSGFSVNHLDIAPPFASVLMGISNTFATLPGIISPALTGVLVQNKSSEEWKTVFYIAAGIYLIGASVYVIFATGEKQSWADIHIEDDIEVPKQEETETFKLPRPKLN